MKCEFKLVDKKEEFSVLEDEKGVKVQWPSDKLPKEVSVGQKVFFDVSGSKFNNQNAKNILNEIFRTDE